VALLRGTGCLGTRLAKTSASGPAGRAGELLRIGTRRAAGGRGAGGDGPLRGGGGTGWGRGAALLLLCSAGVFGPSLVLLGSAEVFEAQQPPGPLAAPALDGCDESVDERCGDGSQGVLCALHQGVPVRPHLAQECQDHAFQPADLPPALLPVAAEFLLQPGQHRVEDVTSLPEQCCPDLWQEAAHSLPLRGHGPRRRRRGGWTRRRRAAGAGGAAEAGGHWHRGRGDDALHVLVVSPHRDPDGLHGHPAQRAAVPQPRPALDAAEAEHVVAWNRVGDVLSHVAADGACPCLFCGHGLLAAGAGRTEDDESFSFTRAAAVVLHCARGREVKVTRCPRVCKSSAVPQQEALPSP